MVQSNTSKGLKPFKENPLQILGTRGVLDLSQTEIMRTGAVSKFGTLVSLVEVGLNPAITQFQSNTCRNCKLSRRRVTYFLYRGFPRRPIAVTRSCESRSASSWSFSRSSSILCSRGCQRSSSNLRRRRSHRCTSHFFRQPFNTLRWPCILVLMCFCLETEMAAECMREANSKQIARL